MINYPLRIKITFKSLADLNYIIFKEGNKISYNVVKGDSEERNRYRITTAKIEEKILFEILYEILFELGLSPADLATTITPIHSEIVLDGGDDFTFNEIKDNIYSWSRTRRR